MRGVSLEEIAGATRISTRFLDALEKEAWDRLPGGVFNRGFVRTVARFLGLEEETLLAEYSLAARLPGSTATDTPSASASLPQTSAAGRERSPWFLIATVVVILAIGAGSWFGWRWASARRAELNAAANALPAAPAPPAAPAVLSGDPANSAAPTTTSTTTPWTVAANGLTLKIDATGDTALTITSDGQQTFSGTILAGESRTVAAKGTLIVEAQDAGAVRLELNGRALAPIGPPGQPGKITLGNSNTKID